MKNLPFNVWLLMCCGALAMSSASVVIFTGGIIGSQLTTNPAMATLPLAFMVVGTALAVVPVTMMMRQFGRKSGFILGSLTSTLGALLAAYAISSGSFLGFCLATTLLGTGLAFVQQYRFAAMESVSPEMMADAAAKVLLGGLIAAFIGPELALWCKDWFSVAYVGSYLALAALYIFSAVLLTRYQNKQLVVNQPDAGGRCLLTIIKQPVFLTALLSATVGYAVMSFIMTATPISMHLHEGHSLADTKWVIQSHIMAMFIPSFFSGRLIKRFGIAAVMYTGLAILGLCVAFALIDRSLLSYWLALVLLGVGWNFLFVSGTALLPSSYHENEKYKAQALNEFSVFSIQAFASLSSGWILFQFGWQILLLISLPFLLVLLIAMLFWKRQGAN